MYEAKIFKKLIGMPGFSDQLLNNHFGLYEGYVKNVNLLDDTLMQMEKEGKFEGPVFAELNRRLGWEWNGMRLHEYYFENLSPKKTEGISLDSKLASKIKIEWGSLDIFEKNFKGMGAMRGIGWVILYYDKMKDRLFNVWINEHDTGHFAGSTPLLVMDVFEHAYMLDYGPKKADYIETFSNHIDWDIVEKRFKQ